MGAVTPFRVVDASSADDTDFMSTEEQGSKPLWRFLGECRQARSQEEIRSRALEGWLVWSEPWQPLREADIVVPDPNDPSRQRHAQLHCAQRDGGVFNFAVDYSDNGQRFYVPASMGEEGAFEAHEARYEGFWRATSSEESELPWPVPEDDWDGRMELLDCLAQVEVIAERILYRGYSFCRICHRLNGDASLRFAGWEWPSGFSHYIADHNVRPSFAFEEFILSQKPIR